MRRVSLVIYVVIIFFAFGGCAIEPQVVAFTAMPAFSPQLEDMQDYYKIQFTEDGYPAKVDDGSYFDHPIYGAYVIHDYLVQYASTKDRALLIASEKVARAALKRMEYNKKYDALIFWYPKGDYVARAYKEHYSGLTQSYYAIELMKLGKETGNPEYLSYAKQCFNSLKIPVGEGGVLHTSVYGPSIEEFPNVPNDYILNGWLTTLVSIAEYVKLSSDKDADKLFLANTETLKKTIHLYDAPDYANSRYSLSGFMTGKIVFPTLTEGKFSVKSAKILVPNDCEYPLEVKSPETTSKYQGYLYSEDMNENGILTGNVIRINMLLSRISYPEPNVLEVIVDSPVDSECDFTVYKGVYSPLSTSQVQREWYPQGTFNLKKGQNKLIMPIHWEAADLIAYPTNFKKSIGSKNYNVYHFVHIQQLEALYEMTGISIFKDFSDKWVSYTKDWPNVKLYKDLQFTRH